MDDDSDPQAEGAETAVVHRREFVARVAEVLSLEPNHARRLVDGVLTELGAALESGATLALPPLGKMKAVDKGARGDGHLYQIKLRRPAPAEDAAAKPAKPGKAEAKPEKAKPGNGDAKPKGKPGAKAAKSDAPLADPAPRRPGKAPAKPAPSAKSRIAAGKAAKPTSREWQGED